MTASLGLGWVDALVFTVLGGSALVGILRGLAFEVLSLLGWLVAWWCAQVWALPLAAALHIGVDGSPLQRGVGFALTFIAVLLGWKLLSWLVQQLVQATPLAPLDRVLGAVFGLMRGGVIVLVVVMGLGLTPVADTATWRAAPSVGWAQALIAALAPILPGTWPKLPEAAGHVGAP
jgi:membrane protein required for colicin V production